MLGAMSAVLISTKPQGIFQIFDWRGVVVPLSLSLALWGVLVLLCPPAVELPLNAAAIGLGAVFAFGALERWPKRLPSWLSRWMLQVIGTALAIPIFATLVFSLFALVPNGEHPFWHGGHPCLAASPG
jgi:hypothetical protein